MVRLLGATLTSLLLFGVTTAAAWAETWCDTDPPVAIVTPSGNLAVVYVADGGAVEHLTSLLAPSISYSTQAIAGGKATNVKLTVTVPNDLLGSGYTVHSEVWSGPLRTGTRYAAADGTAGEPIKLQFTLNVS